MLYKPSGVILSIIGIICGTDIPKECSSSSSENWKWGQRLPSRSLVKIPFSLFPTLRSISHGVMMLPSAKQRNFVVLNSKYTREFSALRQVFQCLLVPVACFASASLPKYFSTYYIRVLRSAQEILPSKKKIGSMASKNVHVSFVIKPYFDIQTFIIRRV